MTSEEKKLSYEEMEKKVAACELMLKQQEAQFKMREGAMLKKMQEMYDALGYRRLDYLFKVVELSDHFSSDFIVTCVTEIEKIMTATDEQETTDSQKNEE